MCLLCFHYSFYGIWSWKGYTKIQSSRYGNLKSRENWLVTIYFISYLGMHCPSSVCVPLWYGLVILLLYSSTELLIIALINHIVGDESLRKFVWLVGCISILNTMFCFNSVTIIAWQKSSCFYCTVHPQFLWDAMVQCRFFVFSRRVEDRQALFFQPFSNHVCRG